MRKFLFHRLNKLGAFFFGVKKGQWMVGGLFTAHVNVNTCIDKLFNGFHMEMSITGTPKNNKQFFINFVGNGKVIHV